MKPSPEKHPFSKNKGIKLLGIGKQEMIKYFFGGNALISIVALVLITALLAKEALYFFPEYKTTLKIYRESGKEFADIAEDQLKYQKELASLVTQVKQYELYGRAGVEAYVPGVFSALKNVGNEYLRAELLGVKIAKQRLESKEMIWGIWLGGDDVGKQNFAKTQKAEFEELLAKAEQDLGNKAQEVIGGLSLDELSMQFKEKAYAIDQNDPEVIQMLKDTLVEYYRGYAKSSKTPENIKEIQSSSSKARAELMKEPFFSNLTEMEKALRGSYKEYNTYVDKLRDHTLSVSVRAEAYLSSAARKKAIEEGIPEATGEKKKELRIALERLVTEDQDYGKAAENIYSTLPEQKTLQDKMVSVTTPALTQLPEKKEFTNKGAVALYEELSKASENYLPFMEERQETLTEWRHDKKVNLLQSIGGFIFGKKWVANSSWQNFFGLRPLFGGSFFITIIAISLATPFAVGAAIYVNRLASPLEQTIIKPIIEFIQAIPSVVLAFLGVVVVGQNILKLSYVSWLSWVPGFPANGEQMMLTAGFLLAFMAIPTMFTLAEDAINNVPKSYNEASLALGASKLQTVFKVIIPCSLSGIVAAVILGFGRIIGETMVVLLVAGGTINWPSTWTDPVHTMTGIIAQSTGEAAPGSIQYRALFLVGLVLFIISLILNSLAQRVIKKYGKKG